jgi:hypothetical protein
MTRRSTIVWIVSAVVVVGAGVTYAAVGPTSAGSAAGARVTAASTPSSLPSPSGTPAGSRPAADATAPATATPGDPASPSSSAPSTGPTAAPPAATTKPVVAVTSVTPHLTYYDFTASSSTLEVGGNVPGLVDSGGSCIVTATRGAVTVTQTFTASPQASSTECGTMRLASPKLTSGTWNLTIGYRSPRAAGASPSTEVTL